MQLIQTVHEPDPWAELEIYRQRYDIEDQLVQVRSLERSIARRRAKATTVVRRLEQLERQLADARRELAAVDREIAGSREIGALLIRDILDQVRTERGEAWTPVAIRGFRMWQIEDNALRGAQMPWTSPLFTASCLREVPGDDIPHSDTRCGPPACGVYVTKELDMFPKSLGGCHWDDYAIGVVALTGKVIEHSEGYRGRRATVVAISARYEGRWLVTATPEHIRLLFEDAGKTMTTLGRTGFPAVAKAHAFLEAHKNKEEMWTSDPN